MDFGMKEMTKMDLEKKVVERHPDGDVDKTRFDYRVTIRSEKILCNEKALKYISNRHDGLDKSFIDVEEIR